MGWPGDQKQTFTFILKLFLDLLSEQSLFSPLGHRKQQWEQLSLVPLSRGLGGRAVVPSCSQSPSGCTTPGQDGI